MSHSNTNPRSWDDQVAEAAHAVAAPYDEDDRDDIKTDIFNAFCRGAKWERSRAKLDKHDKRALDIYKECVEGADPGSPVEHLRFFCSIVMQGQDWLDAEPFFDALSKDKEAIPPAGCAIHPLSSRACDRGTKCCVIDHSQLPTQTPTQTHI